MCKILIVEDDENIRENIVDILESSDYEVLYASNGREALTILDSVRPNLIISDIRMPVMNGIQFLKELSKGTNANIPFIFLTAKGLRRDVRKGMNCGADDYLIKPFSTKELLGAVESRIEKQKKNEKDIENAKLNISKYVPHELRTPLTPILGYSDYILDNTKHLTKEEIVDVVTTIKKSGIRLNNRIDKFLLYSEISLLEASLDKQEIIDEFEYFIDEKKIIDKLLLELKINGRLKDLTIKFENGDVNLSKYYFENVVKELLENAYKFSEAGSNIAIEGKKRKPYYEIVVKDYGNGMTSEEINNIKAFKQFHRNDNQQIGNGLGLISIKKLVDTVKGKFKIESEEGIYTKVTLHIPLINEN